MLKDARQARLHQGLTFGIGQLPRGIQVAALPELLGQAYTGPPCRPERTDAP